MRAQVGSIHIRHSLLLANGGAREHEDGEYVTQRCMIGE